MSVLIAINADRTTFIDVNSIAALSDGGENLVVVRLTTGDKYFFAGTRADFIAFANAEVDAFAVAAAAAYTGTTEAPTAAVEDAEFKRAKGLLLYLASTLI